MAAFFPKYTSYLSIISRVSLEVKIQGYCGKWWHLKEGGGVQDYIQELGVKESEKKAYIYLTKIQKG